VYSCNDVRERVETKIVLSWRVILFSSRGGGFYTKTDKEGINRRSYTSTRKIKGSSLSRAVSRWARGARDCKEAWSLAVTDQKKGSRALENKKKTPSDVKRYPRPRGYSIFLEAGRRIRNKKV